MPWNKYAFRRTPDRKTRIVPVVRSRISIPQPKTRPIDIHSKDLVIKKYVQSNPYWFILHRRGIRRETFGETALEKRAIPMNILRGSLPERIVYKALVDLLHFTPDVDFDFQSSQAGGRLELGGLVADFLFPNLRIVLQVQGPTHNQFLRHRKDEEQSDILAEMGYRVFELDDDLIYNEHRFENWIRNTFNLGGVGSGSGGGSFTSAMGTGMSGTPGNMLLTNSGNEADGADEAMIGAMIDAVTRMI